MAESVDALVSNTSGFTSIPVRPRVWVLKRRKLKNSLRFSFLLPVTRWFADRLNQELYCKNWGRYVFPSNSIFSGNIELISLIFIPTDAFLI